MKRIMVLTSQASLSTQNDVELTLKITECYLPILTLHWMTIFMRFVPFE
ncbi:hypothetical protein JOD82_002095 [Paenibacillus sp. 1182]|nr:hypothetical protein [Paenibacillus sp. 1182]